MKTFFTDQNRIHTRKTGDCDLGFCRNLSRKNIQVPNTKTIARELHRGNQGETYPRMSTMANYNFRWYLIVDICNPRETVKHLVNQYNNSQKKML